MRDFTDFFNVHKVHGPFLCPGTTMHPCGLPIGRAGEDHPMVTSCWNDGCGFGDMKYGFAVLSAETVEAVDLLDRACLAGHVAEIDRLADRVEAVSDGYIVITDADREALKSATADFDDERTGEIIEPWLDAAFGIAHES